MKMEAMCSFETRVDFLRTTQRYDPEDTLFITTAVRTSNPTMKFIVCSGKFSKLQGRHVSI
jgi:hypothetical protein